MRCVKRTQQKQGAWRLSKTVEWQYIQCSGLGRHQDGRRLANEGNRTKAKRPGELASILRPVQDHFQSNLKKMGYKTGNCNVGATTKPS